MQRDDDTAIAAGILVRPNLVWPRAMVDDVVTRSSSVWPFSSVVGCGARGRGGARMPAAMAVSSSRCTSRRRADASQG
ncbi:MAG: hypothetical protein AAGB11_03115, partial [Pseudomonadota bacterium]